MRNTPRIKEALEYTVAKLKRDEKVEGLISETERDDRWKSTQKHNERQICYRRKVYDVMGF